MLLAFLLCAQSGQRRYGPAGRAVVNEAAEENQVDHCYGCDA
jgi:hypothetical protein